MPNDGELYIRYSDTDNGDRDIPAGSTYWLSPAVEIINGFDAGTAVAEDPDQAVRVRVGNRGGNTRTDVTVQVYATDWGTTNPWLQTLGGGAGTPGGPFTVVGNAKVQNGNEGIIDIGWTPAPAELGGADEKHVCLFANVHRPGDGAPQSNPPAFAVPTNQHHAQRNIKLTAAPTLASMAFGLHAANLGDDTEVFLLEVRPVKRGRLAPFENRHLRSARWLGAVQERVGERLAAQPPAKRPLLEFDGRKGEELKVELEAGQQIPVTVRAGKAPRDPGLHRFDIVQRSARTGDVVGGARLIVAVLPKQLVPKRLRRDLDLRAG
jgi:hypothetical protein